VSDIEQARLRWIAERPKYEAFGQLIRHQLDALLKPLGIWFETSARAKEVDSFVKKLIRKRNHTFESLPDKVGARVIIRYLTDIPRVVDAIKARFNSSAPDDKVKQLGIDRVGYQSVHLDGVRFRQQDADSTEYPPTSFWAELQVRTLAQHLWSEMSHDSVYKNDETLSVLPGDIKRRVHLMAGQIEVADREFDRLNSELSMQPDLSLLRVLEKHYFTLTSRRPDLELSIQVLNAFRPLIREDVNVFANRLNDFLAAQHTVLEEVYSQASASGLERTTSFLFQPDVLLIYDLLLSEPTQTRKLWNQNYPEPELERIANAFGISFD
jgi:putative GTP pyrophosphokinase